MSDKIPRWPYATAASPSWPRPLPPSNPTSPPLPSATTTVVVTTLIQSLTALCSVSVPVLAPPTAGQGIGLLPTLAGYFVGIMYVGAATVALLTGSLVLRYGSIRVSQGALLLCAVSMVLLAVLPLSLMPIAALILGTGYGPITPASSHVLAKTTPPHMMSLMFSLKQTGVTLGGAMAGCCCHSLRWPSTGMSRRSPVAVMCVATIAIAQILCARRFRTATATHGTRFR